MAREQLLERGVREALHIKGAPFPRLVTILKRTGKRRAREPAPSSAPIQNPWPCGNRPRPAVRGDDPDPSGNRDPVVLPRIRPGRTLTKTLTNAGDMSGADTEHGRRDDVGQLVLRRLHRRRRELEAARPYDDLPRDLRRRLLLRPGGHLRARLDRFVLVPPVRRRRRRPGGVRIAVASSASVRAIPTAWTYWDFVAGDFGYPTQRHGLPGSCVLHELPLRQHRRLRSGRAAGRCGSRSRSSQAGGTINFEYTDPAQVDDAWGAHLVQQTRSQAVWAGHPDNSRWSVHDARRREHLLVLHRPSPRWPNGSHSSVGPDGNDWLTKLRDFPNFAVTGGVERDGRTSSSPGAPAAARARMTVFDFPNTHGRVVEVDIAARRSSARCRSGTRTTPSPTRHLGRERSKVEVGVILGWGGAANHANCAMGIIGDFVVWFRDDSTRTVQRFGDYLTTRPGPSATAASSAAWGYFVTEVPGDANSCTYQPLLRPLRPGVGVSSGKVCGDMSTQEHRPRRTVRGRFLWRWGCARPRAVLARGRCRSGTTGSRSCSASSPTVGAANSNGCSQPGSPSSRWVSRWRHGWSSGAPQPDGRPPEPRRGRPPRGRPTPTPPLGVLPRQVGQAGDRVGVADRGVGPVMVVLVQPAGQGLAAG